MKKKIQLTTGLCAAVLALSLATTTFADEQTAPITAPISERQDTVTPVSATSESSVATVTNEATAPLPSEETVTPTVEESTPAPAETPVDPRISEIRVIHRRRTLKPDFSPIASSTDVVYKTVEARAFTEYDVSGNGPATVTDENGKTWYRVRYSELDIKDGFHYKSAPEKGTATAPVIEVIHLYDDIDLNPEVVKRARFVDDKGQEIAPSQENSVERSLDLAYEAGLPTAPAQIQANGKTYTFQSADKGELTSHKLHVSNLVTVTYFYKEVTSPVVEKPVTPSTPEKPVQKLRLPKGNNGVKTRVPVSKKTQAKPSSPEVKKFRLPKGNNGTKTRVPVKKANTILSVDYL
ncbi:cell surface protein [Streptococcus sp. 1001283B150225_161107_H12]|uniref:cell surface protein n=1 Tax=Streptococcus sp. 1001283B150225_161107_H12 TaxID=2787122 RepID=UPI001899A346|nr:cell surface protein [Streptococcus sp. 1001283B150225_161107_H12]